MALASLTIATQLAYADNPNVEYFHYYNYPLWFPSRYGWDYDLSGACSLRIAYHWLVYSDGTSNTGEIYGAGFVYSRGDDVFRSYDRCLKRYGETWHLGPMWKW